MKVLAFDTATRATTVGLADSNAGEPVTARDDPDAGARPRHMTQLLALITDVMERAECRWEDIDRLAVGVGPGTFTGLRIGVATARALARARAKPLIGVSTLQSLALGACDDAIDAGHELTVAAIDARRGEVFAAAWASSGAAAPDAGPPLIPPTALAPAELARTLERQRGTVLLVGDGALAFRAVLEGPRTSIPEQSARVHRVQAIHHCRLASGPHAVDHRDVVPEYLRRPDAELSQAAAGRR